MAHGAPKQLLGVHSRQVMLTQWMNGQGLPTVRATQCCHTTENSYAQWDKRAHSDISGVGKHGKFCLEAGPHSSLSYYIIGHTLAKNHVLIASQLIATGLKADEYVSRSAL